MQVDTKAPPSLVHSFSPPTTSKKNKEAKLLSLSLNANNNNNNEENTNQFSEKTIFRTSQKYATKESNSISRCSTASYEDGSASRSQTNSARRHNIRSKRQQQQRNENVDWENLGVKIEDWFDGAKTPDQRIVYRFLKDLKDEEREREERVLSAATSYYHNINDKAQSLEDILNNLKKYRNKFPTNGNGKTQMSLVDHQSAGPAVNGVSSSKSRASTSLPKLKNKRNSLNNSYHDELLDQLSFANNSNQNNGGSNKNNQIFESSTWRVMRHLKSADIRNKYPLPKANPDTHFRNATIFHTCGRPPKSTFLLHPDWV